MFNRHHRIMDGDDLIRNKRRTIINTLSIWSLLRSADIMYGLAHFHS